MRKGLSIAAALLTAFAVTSCAKTPQYSWSGGVSVEEVTQAHSKIGERLNGIDFDGIDTFEEYDEIMSDKAKKFFEETVAELGATDIAEEELYRYAFDVKNYFTTADGIFAVYGMRWAQAQNANYFEVYYLTDDEDSLIYSEPCRLRDVAFICDGSSLYFVHDSGILSVINSDGEIKELYDARVKSENGGYEEAFNITLSGEGNKLTCKLAVVENIADETYRREDIIVYDIANNTLVDHACGEFAPM